jgi:hypothetical protein
MFNLQKARFRVWVDIGIHSLENYIFDLKIFQLCHLNILQLHGFDITAKINQSFQSLHFFIVQKGQSHQVTVACGQ